MLKTSNKILIFFSPQRPPQDRPTDRENFGFWLMTEILGFCFLWWVCKVPASVWQQWWRLLHKLRSCCLLMTLYSPVVTICTASLTFSNSTFCPHSVFICFVWIWEQTAIISLYNINWLVFITETECVYCAVRTECLNGVEVDLVFIKNIY